MHGRRPSTILGTRAVGLSPPKTSDSWHSRHPKAGVQTEPSLNYMNATVRLQAPRPGK
jgi:hypothetical protein